MQILSWFAKVFTAGSDKVVGAPGLQTEAEDYESAFFEADEATRVATGYVSDWSGCHRDGRRGRQTVRDSSSRVGVEFEKGSLWR